MKKPILFIVFCLIFFSFSFGEMEWFRICERAPWPSVTGFQVVVYHNKIWFFTGGFVEGRNQIWCSTDGDSWTKVLDTAPWGRRRQFVAVSFDNKMWILGGWPDSIGRFTWYSIDGRNWIRVPNPVPWSEIWNHTCVVFDNKIWVFHCFYGVWYSTDGHNWICVAETSPASLRVLYSLVVFKNKMWLMGGWIQPQGEPGRDVNDVWYSFDGINWHCVTETAPWRPREGHTAIVRNDTLWLMGGLLDLPETDTFFNDVWYTTDGENWILADDRAEWSGRYKHASVVYDNRLWVLGGRTENGYTSDVWYSIGLSPGIEETKPFTQFTSLSSPTIIRDISRLCGILFDPTGRKVVDLKSATNKNLKPGIYFLIPNTRSELRKIVLIK